MRIALWDIARDRKALLQPLLLASDVFVEIPEEPPAPIEVDVVIASRFSEKDAGRARFRLLQLPGAGTDKIDFAALPPEAAVCNAFEHESPIAEYVFAAMLDHLIGYGAMTRAIAERGWGGAYFSRAPHGELAGKTVGLIGLGHIGAAIAERAKAFGTTVMAVTARPRKSAPNVDWIATADRLGELLGQADFVVVAAPLTESTRGLLGRSEFALMKRTALLINVARAEISVEQDLFDALQQGTIGGAVLDTWYRYPTSAADTVPPANLPFESLPNVRMTPHSAAWTDGVWERRCVVFADNICRLAAGEPLRNVVREGDPARAHARSA
jgi:phosphoglycerate dehydrogenase-like enzyme